VDDFEELVALVLGELDPVRAAELESSLGKRPHAADQLASLRRLCRSLPAADEHVGPSPRVLEQVRALFASSRQRPQVESASAGKALRALIASIVFDSRTQFAVAGFRGGVGSYHLSLTCEIGEIDLRIEPASAPRGRWSVLGQVELAGDADRASIVARRAADELHLVQTTTDDHGMFRFEVGAGTYDIRIGLGDAEVTLPPLEVG
jgi:hypothetical protein